MQDILELPWNTFLVFVFQEEDDVSLLERQALEDLGLLKITDGSQKELAASCTELQENSDVFSSPLFNTWADSSRSARNQKRTLPSVATYRSAEGVLDPPPRSLSNATSTNTNQQSSSGQYPAERFVLPTPSRESKTNYPNILHTSSFTPTERELMSSRDAPLIHFNSTSSFNQQELSGNSAPLVQKSGTRSALRQTSSNPAPFIAPIPLKVSHRKATSRESRVTSASSTSPVETPALTSRVVPSNERDDRPVQVVSPTPKVHVYKHVPSDRSLSLRSAIPLNPGGFSHRIATAPSSSRANAQFRWEPNVPEIIPGAFRPTTSVSRRLPNTLAQDALLDMEVSVYMRAGHDRVVTEGDRRHRPINPLAKVFSEGDSMVSATFWCLLQGNVTTENREISKGAVSVTVVNVYWNPANTTIVFRSGCTAEFNLTLILCLSSYIKPLRIISVKFKHFLWKRVINFQNEKGSFLQRASCDLKWAAYKRSLFPLLCRKMFAYMYIRFCSLRNSSKPETFPTPTPPPRPPLTKIKLVSDFSGTKATTHGSMMVMIQLVRYLHSSSSAGLLQF